MKKINKIILTVLAVIMLLSIVSITAFAWDCGNHSFGDWYVVREATCTESGIEYRDCTRSEFIPGAGYDYCDGWERREISPSHSYGYWYVDKEPTCTESGLECLACNKCGKDIESREIPANGHGFGLCCVEPSCCYYEGYEHYVCGFCDEYYYIYFPMTDHDIGNWQVTKEPTCDNPGQEHRECYHCGGMDEYREIPPTGHSITDWQISKKVTCESNGQEYRHCETCKGEREERIIPATGHSYGAWWTSKIATCAEQGSEKRTCSGCGKVETRSIPKLPHDLKWYTLSVVSCETDGVSHGYCKHCDYLEVKTTSKTGHNYPLEFTVDVEPTCTTNGVKSKHCSRCDSRIVITAIPATGHNYSAWSIVTSATCTTDGSEQRTCLSCSHTETRTVDKLNHNYPLEFTVDVEPICTTDGVKSKHCARCDSRIVITAIPATGHKHEAVITAPTCDEQGYTTYTCECGDSYVADYVDALGHADNDGNGYCDLCYKNLGDTAECSCNCHKSGISKFFFDFMLFFQMIFGSNKECACGVLHY